MNSIDIRLDPQRGALKPGMDLSGRFSWRLDNDPVAIEIRLFNYTSGKGTRDVNVVDRLRVEMPGMSGERSFSFRLPQSPPSMAGTYITVDWALEAVSEPGDTVERVELVVSPTGSRLVLTEFQETP